MNKKIPIGIDNFSEIVLSEKKFLFVDKTLLIKDLIDKGSKVSLIIRPRRWGKTLNMSMLRYFFSPEVNGESTHGIFDNLKIAKINDGQYLQYQGKNPVIFITFKEVKEDNYKDFLDKVRLLIQLVCNELLELEGSDKLTDLDKRNFEKLKGLNPTSVANDVELRDSLKTISYLLRKHHKKKTIILIDEYDTPLNYAYDKEYFEQMVNFFKGMFGSALKGNDALEQGIMTGILRLSKNKMLSDINNLKLYSLLEEQYREYFGFSEEEVKLLLFESDSNIDIKDLQHWYNGYRSGILTDIYNPWSILNCIEDKGTLKPYWIKTGDETLLRDIFSRVNKDTENKLIQLLEGNAIETTIDEYISFDQVNQGGEEVLWSLLWTTGYLKFKEPPTISQTGNYVGYLAISNYEVSCSYRAVFPKWIRAFNRTKYDSFLNNLINGNVELFINGLKEYLLTIPSYFDFPRESNYHTFMLGLTASLKETHDIHSNKEAGFGRLDMLLVPKSISNNLGIILEFKRELAGKEIKQYQKTALEGLQQMDSKKYMAVLNSISHVKKTLKLCLVFYGKEVTYKSVLETLEQQ
jgi:hypothetical protein